MDDVNKRKLVALPSVSGNGGGVEPDAVIAYLEAAPKSDTESAPGRRRRARGRQVVITLDDGLLRGVAARADGEPRSSTIRRMLRWADRHMPRNDR